MARVLVLYGTSEGHTAQVADAIGNRLRALNLSADVIDAAADHYTPELDQYDGIIVAASVHAGQYQKAVRKWVREHARVLDTRCTAFVSMCLGVLQHDPKVDADLDAIVRRFEQETGWHPRIVRTFPGALLYTHYGIVTRWFMKRIAAKAGGDTDTSRDYDYTDWKQVDAFADEFARLVAQPDREGIVKKLAIAGAAALAAILWPIAAAAQADAPQFKQVTTGAEVYRTYCVTCHGSSGRGDGPLAAAMNRKPANLTEIAKRNGGVFPSEMIFKVIDGRTPVRGHGGPNMPAWGEAFQRSREAGDDARVNAVIQSLVDYLDSIQLRPAHDQAVR